MTSVAVTYRIEERDTESGVVLQTWMRGTVERAQVVRLFEVLVRGDEEVGWTLYRPYGGHRLVVVAEPAHSVPVNAAAAVELRASVPAVVRGRVPLGLVGGAR